MIPVRTVAGPGAWASRIICRNLYSLPAADKAMPEDDSWVYNTHRYFRALAKLRAVGDVSALDYLRARDCPTQGYVLPAQNKPWRYCGKLYCPSCHARCASQAYGALVRAFKVRPPDAPVYAGIIWGMAFSEKEMRRTVNKVKPAAAYGRRHQIETKTDFQWVYRLAVLSDRKFDGVRCVKIRSRVGLAVLCAKAFRYPWRWSGKSPYGGLKRAVKSSNNMLKYRHLWSGYGACREDYVPGRNMLDYHGYCPKL